MGLVLVVPGKCEKEFLHAALAREMPGAVHRVVNVKGDANVVKEAAKIRSRLAPDGDVPIFLRDLDDYPCRRALRSGFSKSIPRSDIIIAYRCLEAWYLADEEGINAFLDRLSKPFRARSDADDWSDPQGELKRLLNDHHQPKGREYDKAAFAQAFVQYFCVRRAAARSSSLQRLLDRL